MKKLDELRSIIRIVMCEMNIDKVTKLKTTAGSTHDMHLASLIDDERKFFIKFSYLDDNIWNEGDPDPSIQCISEFIAYKIYQLYPNVKIPARIELIFDPKNGRVGLATSAVKGKMALGRVKPRVLAKKLQAGVYVDIFLANYDVIGTGSGNLMTSDGDKSITRIDPGASFKYRARGGRDKQFDVSASELRTMRDPKFHNGQAAGAILQYADLKVAAKEFIAVPWSSIVKIINDTHRSIIDELNENDMNELRQQWVDEINDIKRILASRYKVVKKHAMNVLSAK